MQKITVDGREYGYNVQKLNRERGDDTISYRVRVALRAAPNRMAETTATFPAFVAVPFSDQPCGPEEHGSNENKRRTAYLRGLPELAVRQAIVELLAAANDVTREGAVSGEG